MIGALVFPVPTYIQSGLQPPPRQELKMLMGKGDEARLRNHYIYGGLRAPTLVLHSIHFNDLSAIQRARTFAGDRRFEVWSDNHDTDLDQSLVSTLVFRSFDPQQNPLTLSSRSPANLRSPNNNITARAEQYEFRLLLIGE